MKKLLLTGLAVVALSSAAYFVYSGIPKDEQSASSPAGGDLYSAIRAQMESFETGLGAKVDLLIPGEMAASMMWNFRGALKDETASKPFFGTIRSVCEDFPNPDCWELVMLSVDGLSVFSEDAVLPDTHLSSVELQEQEAEQQENTITLQPASAVEPPVEEPAAEPQKTWYTRSDNVNGRLGPGTEYEIAFKIPSDLTLTLIETTNDWGLFRYPARNGKDGKIWIWMPLVKQP